jgi:hypothetical protein
LVLGPGAWAPKRIRIQCAEGGWTVSVPHTVQRLREARTWYVYTGSTARPSQIARRLPDGSVYSVQSTYNAQDNVTWSRDPVPRQGRRERRVMAVVASSGEGS